MGGLIGYGQQITLTNVTQEFTGSVYQTNTKRNNIGGSIGWSNGQSGTSSANKANNSIITNLHCIFRGNIIGKNAVGCLSGVSQFTEITNCFIDYGGDSSASPTTGKLTTDTYSGIIVGNFKCQQLNDRKMSNVTAILRQHPTTDEVSVDHNNHFGMMVGILQWCKLEYITVLSNALFKKSTNLGMTVGTDNFNNAAIENCIIVSTSHGYSGSASSMSYKMINSGTIGTFSNVKMFTNQSQNGTGQHNNHVTKVSIGSSTTSNAFSSSDRTAIVEGWYDWSSTDYNRYPIAFDSSKNLYVYRDDPPISTENIAKWGNSRCYVSVGLDANKYGSYDAGDMVRVLDSLGTHHTALSVTGNSSIGTLDDSIDTGSSGITHNITVGTNYSPNDVITNLSTLRTKAGRRRQTLFLKYIPRHTKASNSSSRSFKVFDSGDSITSKPSTGFYIPDSSGSLTFGNKSITWDGSTVSVGGSAIGANDLVTVTFDSTDYEYYFAAGSIEGDEGEEGGGGGGDPHIEPLIGVNYDLPHNDNSYILFATKDNSLVVKAKCWYLPEKYITRIVDKYEKNNYFARALRYKEALEEGTFFKYIKFRFKQHIFIIDMDDLKIKKYTSPDDLDDYILPDIESKPKLGKDIGISHIDKSKNNLFLRTDCRESDSVLQRIVSLNTNKGSIIFRLAKDDKDFINRNSINVSFKFKNVNINNYYGILVREEDMKCINF